MESSFTRPQAPTTTAASAAGIRPLSNGMRIMLYAASALVFLVGIQLFILTELTDKYFAWTINPSLTAAFLGGAYWASCAIEFLSARERVWARARVAVPAVLTFTTLTLITTLLHIDKFHFTRPEFETVLAAWSWTLVYASVPLIMSMLLYQQMRLPGGDPPRLAPLPPWLRAVLGAQAALMLGLGIALFLVPQAVLGLWPWTLTPLTARAIGAWLLGLGLAAAHADWENDWTRIRPAIISYLVLSITEFLALARYAGSFQWSSLSGWAYLIFLLSILGVGVYSFWAGRAYHHT